MTVNLIKNDIYMKVVVIVLTKTELLAIGKITVKGHSHIIHINQNLVSYYLLYLQCKYNSTVISLGNLTF